MSLGICRVLTTLHAKKSAVYGDAWRKRGEILSIFPNVARKYDRLEVAKQSGELELAARGALGRTVEPLLDTLADLAVYAVKYLTFLAETQPDAFPPMMAASFADFPGALQAVLTTEDGAGMVPIPNGGVAALFDEIAAAMRRVEVVLLGPPTVGARREKVQAVVTIAARALVLINRLAAASPDLWSTFEHDVDAL